MNTILAATLLAGAVLSTSPPAGADELNTVLDLSLRFGPSGFTLNGLVNGPQGPTKGTVTGTFRDDGMAVDGRVDDRGKIWQFELDADAKGGFRAIVRESPPRI